MRTQDRLVAGSLYWKGVLMMSQLRRNVEHLRTISVTKAYHAWSLITKYSHSCRRNVKERLQITTHDVVPTLRNSFQRSWYRIIFVLSWEWLNQSQNNKRGFTLSKKDNLRYVLRFDPNFVPCPKHGWLAIKKGWIGTRQGERRIKNKL